MNKEVSSSVYKLQKKISVSCVVYALIETVAKAIAPHL